MGQSGAAINKALQTHVTLSKETEEPHFNPRAEKPQAEISPDAPLTLPLDMKIGMVETENDVGRMKHHLCETQKHRAHECYLFPLHYSASAVDPLSFASFCAWPPQRFPVFPRQMSSKPPSE